MTDSFSAHKSFEHQGKTYRIASLPALREAGIDVDRLPFAMKVLLENLLRREDGDVVDADAVRAVANWQPNDGERQEIAYMPGRVLLQDFTGVPAVVDLAAMRDAMVKLGGDPQRINPLQPVELVIDHSVQVDAFGRPDARTINSDLEFTRNRERYSFLRWGQTAFEHFKAVPPDTGIVHQVNLEFLARVVMTDEAGGSNWLYPDTVVGTDSHTTMINGLGVLGWGVGGIEAEAAMLGQPVSMLIPDVVGVKLTGKLPEGATATDMVLRVTEMLRAHGVVGKFVEFFGPGLPEMSLADRATIANMAPEYGATCGLFPIDAETISYLRFTNRVAEAELAEAYAKVQGLYHDSNSVEAEYTDRLELDLSTIVPSLAGPKRPQDRVALGDVKANFAEVLEGQMGAPARTGGVPTEYAGRSFDLDNGAVVIAAITSCTNTSNPSVMLAAGLVAKKAVERGLTTAPWVKTSLAPGSKVVTAYLEQAGLLGYLDQLRFNVVGYGCTTCIGNSGPLPEPIAASIESGKLAVTSVLSGNRNFEGRVHALTRANYLASPPLVVAYALAGRVDIDLTTEPIGTDKTGKEVFLKDIWPSQAEIRETVRSNVSAEQFARIYADVYTGSEAWQAIQIPEGATYAWDAGSTYVQHPPYFEGLSTTVDEVHDIEGARVLALLGDSVTTDHISPAGAIKADSPAGRYLQEHGVEPVDFNSYGSRRGNHEVMMRGTFANIRIRNRLVPGVEGGYTVHHGTGEQMSIYDAAMAYKDAGIPSMVIAGKEYGTGSSRDWAAKGPMLQGVRVVITESYERIHRSNLIGMGILPLQFAPGDSAESLGLTGTETFDVRGLAALFAGRFAGGGRVAVTATGTDGKVTSFEALVRIDTPKEGEYYRHGGILNYVLRSLVD
ncbi:aconitate hydratase AcnA [Engelhardtia mirabilis]|uniref:Aconitate hydratase n=1 Tax=Engelhardtia mirabilis TaxID=2528011 RepID=A0A518BHT7_9BACT|nr:Aconitate hydratase [Planctomycetes bacterium Pla133]QDV00840.1 Aconitate hydratase [Planctomycetes bacterium Pla86]